MVSADGEGKKPRETSFTRVISKRRPVKTQPALPGRASVPRLGPQPGAEPEVLGPELPEVLDAQEPEVLDGLDEEEQEPALVVSSDLSRYLAEMRKYDLLTPEEERRIAHLAYDQGDMAARSRLITSNLRLVVKIAMEYRRAYHQVLDLIQEGNAGLVQAVNRFNPYKGVRLSTYGAWWIRAYILKFLMDNRSLVRMGTTDAQRKLFFRLRAEAEKLYAQTQRFDPQLLAENIGVKERDVLEMQERLTKGDVSLDAPAQGDDARTPGDRLVSSTDGPLDALEKRQIASLLGEQVVRFQETLSQRDLYIFTQRILAEDPVTLQDVGTRFGITRERARQLESRLLKRMKELLLGAGVVP